MVAPPDRCPRRPPATTDGARRRVGGHRGPVARVSRSSSPAGGCGVEGDQAQRGGQQPAGDAGGQAPPGRLGGRGAAAVVAAAPMSCGVAAAHAGLGQVELDVAGGGPVAGEGGDDGADLLVAGGHAGTSGRGRRTSCRRRSSRAPGGRARRRRAGGRCRRSARSGRSAGRGRGSSPGSGRGPGAARRRCEWSGRKPVAATIRSAVIVSSLPSACRTTTVTRPSVGVSACTEKPVSSRIRPASTCARSREPSAPRAGRASASPPP